jgi:hypothetical protein
MKRKRSFHVSTITFVSPVVRFHQFVRLDHLRKPFDARSVRPWFDLTFLPHHISKAARPFLSWKRPSDTFDRAFSNQLSVQARVVKNGGEVDNRSESADPSRVSQILVSDNRLTHSFCLRDFRFLGFEQLECDEAAGEFEREVRGSVVRGCGSDVVEESCEQESLGAALPGGKVLGHDGSACGQSVSYCGWD